MRIVLGLLFLCMPEIYFFPGGFQIEWENRAGDYLEIEFRYAGKFKGIKAYCEKGK